MFRLALIACATFVIAFSIGSASADTLDNVKAKGTLVVGVKADYPPWGMRDQAGNIVGLEIDMANDVAKRLGVKLQLVPVESSNRMQFLQQGKIDVMIATFSVNDERRKTVGVVEPLYYASGGGLLAKNGSGIAGLKDLQGKKVCANQGSYFNKEVAEKYVQGNLLAFKGVPESEQALLSDQCSVYLFDDVILIYKKTSDPAKWKDYDVIQLPEIQPLPWAVAVRSDERDGPWGKMMSSIVSDWHRSGMLLALEKKWLGQNTRWLEDMHAKAKAGQH
jgi:polar amino acid transport system substrate-binding protein